MFASLGEIDIALNGGGGVIVDDRTAGEIEAEPSLSMLFALTRVCQYIRADHGSLIVYFTPKGETPSFLAEAIGAAGPASQSGQLRASAHAHAHGVALPFGDHDERRLHLVR
jgi:hypothetical protein